MIEKPIKVDEATDLLVSELAYFLGCTKKNVVREAVAEFAEVRGRPPVRHPAGALARSSPSPAAPSSAPRTPRAAPSRNGSAHDETIANEPASEGPTPERGAAPREAAVPDGAAAPEGAATFRDLTLRERLALRRSELIREFARQGASGVRLIGQLARDDEDEDDEGGALEQGEPLELVELLVDTDMLDGSSAAPKLEGIASRLLAAPCQVTSATALRLFDPDGLRRAMTQSRPF